MHPETRPATTTDTADAVVVGAGPAGSTAAHLLARGGARTIVLERHRMPRDKSCGDALLPDALAVLRDLGLHDEVRAAGHAIGLVRIYAPNGTPFEVSGEFVTVARRTLDALLVRNAVAAGAALVEGARVSGFERDADGVTVRGTVDGAARAWRAPIVVLACGADSGTARAFGLLRRPAASAVAMRTYWRLRPDVDASSLRIWYERPLLPGYGWIFPMGGGVFNVGAGVLCDERGGAPNLHELLETFVSQCAAAREDLRGGTPLDPLRGAPLRTSLCGTAPSAERVLACGESVGATCAFTGEGIGKAMQTAQVAAEVALRALSAGRFDAASLREHDERLEARFRTHFRQYDVAQSWLRHPWVVNFVASRARRSTRVRRALEDALAERGPPTAVLSLPGLARALITR
jgi:geranylgeranyl reductase family protein